MIDYLELKFGAFKWSTLLFDPNTGYAPMYVWHRRRGEKAHVPVPIYDTNVDLIPFTALTMPS